MARVRTFTLPHYQAYPVHVALFTHVNNAAFLRTQLRAANVDFDYAFLDAEMILSPAHLLSAAFLTIHALSTRRQKTRTPHSELVFRLSPTNNIGDSYAKFGLTDTTTTLIAIKLPLKQSTQPHAPPWVVDDTLTNQSVSDHLATLVDGSSVDIGEKGDELGQCCHVDKIRKVYKLGDAGTTEDDKKHMELVILGTIALKGA
ncbi:hypothetical protein ACEQ8H_002651 [Pleosporales sp. CAS-2024a]